MVFLNDIELLIPSSNKSFNPIGARLPTSTDLFFRAKQREIIDQYFGARLYLEETETTDWQHWFKPIDAPQLNVAFQEKLRAYFYEAALMYYNALVDLSWTLCYICAEFAINKNGKRIELDGMASIEEAASLLRDAESLVTSPTAEENPFAYLKWMCPKFETAMDHSDTQLKTAARPAKSSK